MKKLLGIVVLGFLIIKPVIGIEPKIIELHQIMQANMKFIEKKIYLFFYCPKASLASSSV